MTIYSQLQTVSAVRQLQRVGIKVTIQAPCRCNAKVIKYNI